jgi:hypothetical protein
MFFIPQLLFHRSSAVMLPRSIDGASTKNGYTWPLRAPEWKNLHEMFIP